MGKLKTHEMFIEELKEKNKGFDKTFTVVGEYSNANKKITVSTNYGICRIIPNSLLRGYLPTISSAIDRNSFCVNMFKEVHRDLYEYSNVKYLRSKTKVDIVCKKHGIFLQTPKEHLKGSGCPTCAKLVNSFSFEQWKNINKNNKAVLYVLSCEGLEEDFIKVGITSLSVKERYKGVKRMPYSYTVEYQFTTHNRKLIWDTEKEIKTLLEKYNPKLKFKGSALECFRSVDKEKILKIINNRIDEAVRRS
jgi:hypothetical protein